MTTATGPQITAARLSAAIDARTARCSVIGLGFIGSTLMDAMIEAGFRPVGYDRSPAAAAGFSRWIQERYPDRSGRWSLTSDAESLADSDIILVAVRLPVLDHGTVDDEPLQAVASLLRREVRNERLILMMSTVPCGATRAFAKSLGGDQRTLVAHSPERLSAGQDRTVLRRIPHLVGGLTEAATEVGARFLGTLCDQVVPVSAPEVSELSKLLENAFLSTGIALVTEVTRIAHRVGIPAAEVCQAAATKSSGYFPFYPGPGVGGHCLPNDLELLASAGRARGLNTPLLEAVAATNAGAPRVVVNRLQTILRAAGQDLNGARVLLVGIGFKIGSSDTTASPAVDIVRLLRIHGASPAFTDSTVFQFAVDTQAVDRVDADELRGRHFDACIVLSGDRDLAGATVAGAAACVLDAGGGRILKGGIKGAYTL